MILPSLKSFVIGAVALSIITVVGSLWVQNRMKDSRIEHLSHEKVLLETAVLAREIEVRGLKIAIEVLEDTFKSIEEHRLIEAEIEEEIHNAAPEEDGPIAPVLRRSLDGVGRMLHDAR